jgi:glycosyltransferase involved in cell wall biosynthesis
LESGGAALERLVRLLEDYQPTLVYAPALLEIHPDHRAAGRLLWAALPRVAGRTLVAFYEVTRALNANTLIDISPVIERKKAACDTYASQLLHHPYTDCVLGLNRFRALSVAPACRFAEALFVIDSQEIVAQPAEYYAPLQLLPALSRTSAAQPLVSVVIRTRNRPTLLREALASVLAQTWPILEVIVVNDGGVDVADVIDEFGARLRIRHHCEPQSNGRSAAANTGVGLSQGKYVNFLDDDDLLAPGHVEKLVTFLERTGEDLAYSDCEQGFYQWTGSAFVLKGQRHQFFGEDYDRDRLYFSNFIPIMTAMFSRRLWDLAGPMDPALNALEDWDLWLRMSERVDLHRVPGITAEYRIFASHPISYASHLRVLEKHAAYWTFEKLIQNVWPRLHALQEERIELRSLLADQRKRNTELELRVQSADPAAVSALRDAASEVARVKGEWAAEAARLAAGLGGWQNRAARAQEELDSRLAELRAIRASTSWRLSLPVRWLGHLRMRGFRAR